jgi:hypothetical protein
MQQRPLCELGKLQQPVWYRPASHPRTTSGSCGIFASKWSRPWIGFTAYGAAHCRYQESEACWLCLATAPGTPAAGSGESRFNGAADGGACSGGARDDAVTA